MRHELTPRLRRLGARLPGGIDPLADRAKDLVHDARGLAALRRWVSTVHEGPLPHGGPTVRVAYVGRALFERDALLPFCQHAAPGAFRREVLREGGLVALARARRRPGLIVDADADVVLVDPPFAWTGGLRGAFRYPVFLRGALALGSSLDEQLTRVRSKPYRRVLKRALKRGASWRVSRSEGDLRDFYEAMYEPLARNRFGDAANVSPYERLASALRHRGELLLVERERTPVIGALLYRSPRAPGTVFNWKYGVRDPAAVDAAGLRELTASLEIALFEHAISRQDARVDFGLTSAVANDGVYVHKRRLGCDFTPLPRGPELLLRFAEGVEAAVLERAPLFVRDGAALRCLTGYTGQRDGSGEPFAKGVLREHTFEGCGRATLFVDGAEPDDVLSEREPPVDVVRRHQRDAARPREEGDRAARAAVDEGGARPAHDAPPRAPAGIADGR